MISSRVHHRVVRLLPLAWAVVPVATVAAQAPWWRDSLGYTHTQLFQIRVADGGFPYVPVQIDGTELWLLFDTGNMAGLTLETREYERLSLPAIRTIRRRDSNGDLVGEFRVGRAGGVRALGHTASDVVVREFRHPRLAGLFGPDDLPGSRFTLDYHAATIAVTDAALGLPAGPDAMPMVRSARHPRLILVEGEFRGEQVLIELDTGKSRTVIDPAWAARLGLTVGETDTVAVGILHIGDAAFDVRNAKPVGLGAIDPSLPAPLGLSLGSDTLSRFVLTVDYTRGLVLLWQSRE